MENKKTSFLLIGLMFVFTLNGCISHFYVELREDGTAYVEQNYSPWMQSHDHYYRSEIITRIDTTEFDAHIIKFEINNIDSLGKYMMIFHPEFFEFQHSNDSLVITFGKSQPYIRETIDHDLNLGISLPGKLVHSSYPKSIRYKEKRGVYYFRKSTRKLNKMQGEERIVLEYKN